MASITAQWSWLIRVIGPHGSPTSWWKAVNDEGGLHGAVRSCAPWPQLLIAGARSATTNEVAFIVDHSLL
jgi:hypothetical protein